MHAERDDGRRERRSRTKVRVRVRVRVKGKWVGSRKLKVVQKINGSTRRADVQILLYLKPPLFSLTHSGLFSSISLFRMSDATTSVSVCGWFGLKGRRWCPVLPIAIQAAAKVPVLFLGGVRGVSSRS